MSKEIPITKNKTVLVDDDWFDYLNQWKWHYSKGYAVRTEGVNRKAILMHRVIMNTPKGLVTDHINRDGLDNRISNLRIATQSENLSNSPKQRNNTSGYKGVTFQKSRNKWAAQIEVQRKMMNLGRYDNPEDAARAYDKAAKKYFRNYAVLNFQEQD